MEFKDRVSNKPNRVKLTYDEGGDSTYATVELADEPIEEGTPLNALNMNKLLNKEDNDYIVEQGTSDIWKYTKWASGKIELWTNSIPHTINFENYNLIWASMESNILVPIVTDIESVNGDSTHWFYANWASVTKNGSVQQAIDIRYYGVNSNGNGDTINFSAYVIGRWK